MPGVTDWTAFLATEVGASAALAGLIFVGVSINLKSIVSPQSPALPNRALEALLALLAVLILASLLLIPAQPQVVIGVETLVVGVATWVALTVIQVRDWRRTPGEYWRIFWARALLTQLASLPFIAAGVSILRSGSWVGFYLIALAVVFSFLLAFLNTWILVIEISR